MFFRHLGFVVLINKVRAQKEIFLKERLYVCVTCCCPRNGWAWDRKRTDLCRAPQTHPEWEAPPPGCRPCRQLSEAPPPPPPSPSSSSASPAWAESEFSAGLRGLCWWWAERKLHRTHKSVWWWWPWFHYYRIYKTIFWPAMRFIQEASSMPRLLLRIFRMLPRMMLRCSDVTVVLQTDALFSGQFSGPFSHQYDR